MKQTYRRYLRIFLYGACVYMVVESVLHLSGIRLLHTSPPLEPALVRFILMYMHLWGFSAAFFAWLLWRVAQNIGQSAHLLLPIAVILLLASLTGFEASLYPFSSQLPSAYMYLGVPWYGQILVIESVVALALSLYLFWGRYRRYI